MASDARLHPRLRLSVTADVIGREVVLGREVEDISMGGCRFVGPAWEPEGGTVKLVFAFPESNNSVVLDGRIVRASGEDMGVRFIDISDEQKWALRKQVREAQGH